MELDPTGIVCALVLASATGTLGAAVGHRLGYRKGWKKGADRQVAPKGPAVVNADVARECHLSHNACRGKGTIKGGTELCPVARTRFERRHAKDLVLWNGRLHWKEART